MQNSHTCVENFFMGLIFSLSLRYKINEINKNKRNQTQRYHHQKTPIGFFNVCSKQNTIQSMSVLIYCWILAKIITDCG